MSQNVKNKKIQKNANANASTGPKRTLKQQTEAEKPNPLSSQVANKNSFRSKKSKEGTKQGHNEPKGDFYRPLDGLAVRRTFLGRRVSLAHPEVLPISVDQVNIDR